jgi:hypothetical protein
MADFQCRVTSINGLLRQGLQGRHEAPRLKQKGRHKAGLFSDKMLSSD